MAINEKRPVILRTVLALLVIGIFAWSTYPLQERDFYETFRSKFKADKSAQGEELIADAKKLQEAEPDMFDMKALVTAADNKGVMLTEVADIPDTKDSNTNADAASSLRKLTSASIRRGIDLAGGVEFTLRLEPEEGSEIADADFDRYRDVAIEILRKRLENNKIFESEIAPAGARLISLKVPITSKSEKQQLQQLLSMSAKLHFRLVHENNATLIAQVAEMHNGELPLKADAQIKKICPRGYEYMTISEFQKGKKASIQAYFVKVRPEMDGKNIKEARPARDEYNRLRITFTFHEKGAADFARVTEENIGRQLAVVLDGKLYTAPTIQTAIKAGSGEITGQFSDDDAKNIANALQSGNFPFMIKVESVYDVDPTLGKDNVANGIRAGIYGMIAVVVFMIAYYLIAGITAVIALLVNVVLVLGALAAFDATLTLPGIAGIVLTIGMAVDANVLIFERIREELKQGKTLATAIDAGYSKALSAVLDSNLTTLFTGLILYWAGSGAIKGFAVTLCIGILTSLFTALFLNRLIFDYLLRLGLKKLPMHQLLKNPRLNFLGKRKIAFAVSGLIILFSIGLMAFQNKNMFAVDLSGGTVAVYGYDKNVSSQQLADTLAKNGFTGARIAYKNSGSDAADKKLEIMVRETGSDKNGSTPGKQIQEILNKQYPELKLTDSQENSVGGLVGAEFTKAAIIAVIISVIGMIIYITLRYEIAYALAAIIALAHDVIISLGIFLLMGQKISLAVIAAVLTIIGYSINDTIVIFDRIREDLRSKTGMSYAQVINYSINTTLNRTLLTSITTLLAVAMLLIFGGAAIRDFVLLMFIGIIVGTYSSVFIASPIVALWHRKVNGVRESDVNFDESKVVEE